MSNPIAKRGGLPLYSSVPFPAGRPPAVGRAQAPLVAQVPSGLRLPSIPAPAYDPPPPKGLDPTPQTSAAARREIKNFSLVDPPSGLSEILLFTFDSPWRGCDVYLYPPATIFQAFQGFARVKIYAVSDVGRALVASGMYAPAITPPGGIGLTPSGAIWIAGVRGIAQRFEVTCALSGAIITPGTVGNTLQAVGIASDEATTIPREVGESRLAAAGLITGACLPGNGAGSDDKLAMLVTKIVAGNTAPAFRYLQLHAAATVAGASVLTLRDVIAIPPGQTVVVDQPMGRYTQSGLVAIVSTTPQILTAAAAGDVVYEVWGR